MKVEIVKNYDKLSEACADIMLSTVKQNPGANLVIATGYSPLEAYRIFVRRVKEEKVDISSITIIKLDEWVGLDPEDPATCEYFIQQELLKPLGITEKHYISFDGKAKDMKKECDRIQDELERLKEVNLAILGIGKNGHLGLNEPGEYLHPYPHVIELDTRTKTHAMLKNTDQMVSYGVTLGMKNLMDSEQIILLATGEEKEEAIRTVRSGLITTKVPATLLNLHKNVICLTEIKG